MGILGDPIKPDTATVNRDKISYVRYLVEMMIDGDFPEEIAFVSEKGIEVSYKVHYEWKPTRCSECKMIGHKQGQCNPPKKVWRPKLNQNNASKEQIETEKEVPTVFGGVENIINNEEESREFQASQAASQPNVQKDITVEKSKENEWTVVTRAKAAKRVSLKQTSQQGQRQNDVVQVGEIRVDMTPGKGVSEDPDHG